MSASRKRSLFSRLFRRSRSEYDPNLRLGQVLMQEGLISEEQLRQALEEQRQHKLRLGQTLVKLGVVDEARVVDAVNRRYNVDLSSLGDDLQARLQSKGGDVVRGRGGLRVPIKAQLSIAMIAVIWLTILGLSFVILTRQRDLLYDQTVRTGKVSLNYISQNARVPLVNGDILSLNSLVKEAAQVEGVAYAIVVNREGMVQAHTNPERVRQQLELSLDGREIRQEGNVSFFDYTGEGGTHLINLSRPVRFQETELGVAHVGISLDFIQEQIRSETFFIVLLSFLIIALGIVIAIFLGVGFSRPISDLVTAMREFGSGNLKYKIRSRRNDELGDLADAFNYMGDELWKKQLMQESFGKYVGSEVLDLIMADPENAWLRGTRNNATVLFTDIRGFTSFSETREPEAVVEALNAYFDVATRHIQARGGYVDKFIGDAVMGVFGVPLPSEDHIAQAVAAAMEMQEELAEAAARTGNEILASVGIGLNAGFVVAGNIGSQDKMEYTVIGDTVNVASRLNSLAGAGEVVISEYVYEAIKRNPIRVEQREPQAVKGKSEPVQTFKVVSFSAPPRVAKAEGASRDEQQHSA